MTVVCLSTLLIYLFGNDGTGTGSGTGSGSSAMMVMVEVVVVVVVMVVVVNEWFDSRNNNMEFHVIEFRLIQM